MYDANGNQLSQQILSTEVIKEPVTKKVGGHQEGDFQYQYITGSGQFIWPVPGYRYCSRWYGGSHKGVDICAAAGTPIYASAGGTVTKAGYNRAGAGTGYGYSVIINHGSGYTTVYAHCLSLTVSAGSRSSRASSSAIWAAPDVPAATTATLRYVSMASYIPPQNVFPGKK